MIIESFIADNFLQPKTIGIQQGKRGRKEIAVTCVDEQAQSAD